MSCPLFALAYKDTDWSEGFTLSPLAFEGLKKVICCHPIVAFTRSSMVDCSFTWMQAKETNPEESNSHADPTAHRSHRLRLNPTSQAWKNNYPSYSWKWLQLALAWISSNTAGRLIFFVNMALSWAGIPLLGFSPALLDYFLCHLTP